VRHHDVGAGRGSNSSARASRLPQSSSLFSSSSRQQRLHHQRSVLTRSSSCVVTAKLVASVAADHLARRFNRCSAVNAMLIEPQRPGVTGVGLRPRPPFRVARWRSARESRSGGLSDHCSRFTVHGIWCKRLELKTRSALYLRRHVTAGIWE